jgi:CubicO group peptidase (beta-lactamase class C family)
MKKKLCLLFILILNFGIVHNTLSETFKEKTTKSVHEFIELHPQLNAVYEFRKGNQTLFKGASGYFSIDKQIKLKSDQEMLIASGTKNIIAAAILKLEEKGLLKVSDPISKHFPSTSDVWKVDGYNGNKFPDWANEATIHHLLTHTSGIKEYVFNIKIDPTQTHNEINKNIIQFAASNSLEFKPGEKYAYSNTGYVILGMIIEKITKTPLADHLNKTFFIPLGMKHTHMASLQEVIDYRHGKITKYPDLYFAHYKGDQFEFKRAETNFFFVPYADGGIISTTSDLLNWHYKLHHGQILSKASYNKMIKPYALVPHKAGMKSQSGYGIYIAKLNDKDNIYYHSGKAAGIRSESGYIPAKDFGFVIISNVMPMLEHQKIVKSQDPKQQLDIFFLLEHVLKGV